MTHKITILNGPNLNMLGLREPELYGHKTLDDVQTDCETLARDLGANLTFLQSNYEGQLIEWIQNARTEADGIIINPAGLSHTSVALLDALHLFEGPVIEVHISNILKREAFRHHSYVSLRADGAIIGCGTRGYSMALRQVVAILTESK